MILPKMTKARVLAKINEGERTLSSGIIIPERPYDFNQRSDVGTRAVVYAIGPWQMEVKRGDEVIIDKFGGIEVRLNGEIFVVLEPDELLAIVEGEPAWRRSIG